MVKFVFQDNNLTFYFYLQFKQACFKNGKTKKKDASIK